MLVGHFSAQKREMFFLGRSRTSGNLSRSMIKGNQKGAAAISLQTVLVEEKKRGRGEEKQQTKVCISLQLTWSGGETLSMENIHEALSHSHSQSSAQSHFCSISFLWLSHMKDTTFKEDTMADCSRLMPDIRRHSEYMLCTNTLKICTTQSPLSTNRSQWPSLSYLE